MTEDFDFDWNYGAPKRPFEAKLLPDAEKQRICEDLLSQFGVQRWTVNRKGEMIHSCPIPGKHLNGDRRPSASLNFRHLTFKCYGCGSQGGLLWFIATCRETSSEEARRWLGGEAGLDGEVMTLETLLRIVDQLYARPETTPIPRYDPAVLDPWLSWTTPHPYLTDPTAQGGRGIPHETLWYFAVGYAPEYRLRNLDGELVTQERVVIPLYWKEQLVGWQARAIDGADEPKYHNSPDFPRDTALFNYGRRRHAVLVESPMSVLRHYHHVPTMISSYGAHPSDEQVRWLRRFDQVTVWLDNDDAGWEGTDRVIEELSAYTDVQVVPSDLDADPADLTDDAVDTLLGNALPWPLWHRPERLRPKEMI